MKPDYDTILNIIKQIKNPDDLDSFCKTHPNNYTFCRSFNTEIIKHILNVNQVNYYDPTCLIYVWSSPGAFNTVYNPSTNTFDLEKIYSLYTSLNKQTVVHLPGKLVTSVPVLHNLIDCDLSTNMISHFPVQPALVKCKLSHNRLTTFPSHPFLTECYLSNNLLNTFDVQPSLQVCDLSNNKLTLFPVHPKLIVCIIDNNLLINFPTQPQLRVLSIENNALTNASLSIQPMMIKCSGDGNITPLHYCKSVSTQVPLEF
jgi:hypothetical protein